MISIEKTFIIVPMPEIKKTPTDTKPDNKPDSKPGTKETKPAAAHSHKREIIFILLLGLTLFLFLAFISYHRSDPAWSTTGTTLHTQNIVGKIGAFFSDIGLYLFGYVAYLFPIATGYFARRSLKQTDITFSQQVFWIKTLGIVLMLLSLCALFSLHVPASKTYLPYTSGGIVGTLLAPALVAILNKVGTSIILFVAFLVGATLTLGVSWLSLFQKLLQKIKAFYAHYREEQLAAQNVAPPMPAPMKDMPAVAPKIIKPLIPRIVEKNESPATVEKPAKSLPKADPKSEKILSSSDLPSLELLAEAKHEGYKGYSEERLSELSVMIERKLAEFGIDVKVMEVHPGPVITRFELDLAAGVKVSKLTALSKDIARALSFVSVRIVEAIPGKSFVGLEIPNQHREMVRLREILSDKNYLDAKSPLTLGLGKDIAGNPVSVDLAKMPHLLVAGTTGSGKSVGLNAMLLSLLYKSTPSDVRLILVDPKMLELAIYDGIPHLLTPVITDMKLAANALRWAIGEMERRYRLMSKLGVRNILGYNEKISSSPEPILDPLWEDKEQPAPRLEKLPYIVLLIDEFADLMMVVGKKIDELIARLAQKARAAGIHLILATQRPSVDVITGLIKANIPTRMAFQVSSRIDSRTILDQMGAEQLLGHGDMLYMEAGMGVPNRIHGAFVADDEVHHVVDYLKEKSSPVYIESITKSEDIDSPLANIDGVDFGDRKSEGGGDVDELFDEAVDIVARTRRASISSVQRRLKIGYNRAATILEQMEAQGMVSAMQANGTREVLLPPRGDGEDE